MIYPWLRPYWQRFSECIATARLPHALLLAAPPGYGKTEFALQCCRELLGMQDKSGNDYHPDLHLLANDLGPHIKLEQVQSLQKRLQQIPHGSRYACAIINPAEKMTLSAANALLKILEEPITTTFMVLVANELGAIPATVKSRCQIWALDKDSKYSVKKDYLIEQGVEDPELWLDVAQGAPLAAIEQANHKAQLEEIFAQLTALKNGQVSPDVLVAHWHDRPCDELWLGLYYWTICGIRWLQGLPCPIHHAIFGVSQPSTVCQRLFKVLDELYAIKRERQARVPLNQRSWLERVIFGIAYA